MEYDLTEPLKAYNYYLKDAVHENAANYFDGLVQSNNIDIDANRFTNQQLAKGRKKIEDTKKALNGKKGLKAFIIVSFILCFVAALVFIIVLFSHFIWWFILIALGLIAGGVGLIFLMRKINKGIREVEDTLAKYQEKYDELLAEARAQMKPLNDAYDWNIPAKIMSDTIPLIQMDRMFDANKFYYLRNKYGFKENEENISSLFVQSGSILGNPFILERNFVREIRDHTYEGRLVIHWTTVVGSGKNRHVVNHTQTLIAHVTKPRPEYYDETWLVYGNEAAPRLSFSRTPSNIAGKNEKQLQKYISDYYEDLDKKMKKRSLSKVPFTLMANEEFEALFKSTDRDNDVEFNLLFTPLAQKNMIDLIKNGKPYGDDFQFIKNKQLNYIKSYHMQKAEIDGDPNKFRSYDHDAARNYFINYCDNFFTSFYFELAPLLCIPLYQQHMAFEEIFKGTVDPNLTSFETEVMANKFDQDLFKHADSDTPAILKRESVRKNGNDGDIVNIRAYSYKAVPHVEFVTKMGGDGLPHQVALLPVNSVSQPGRKAVPGDLFSGAVSPELGRTSGTQLTGEGKTKWTGLCSVGDL